MVEKICGGRSLPENAPNKRGICPGKKILKKVLTKEKEYGNISVSKEREETT